MFPFTFPFNDWLCIAWKSYLQEHHHVEKKWSCKEGVNEVEEKPGHDEKGEGGQGPPARQHVRHHQHQVDRDRQGKVLPRVLYQVGLHSWVEDTLLKLGIVGVDEADDVVDVLLGVVQDDEVGDQGSGVE